MFRGQDMSGDPRTLESLEADSKAWHQYVCECVYVWRGQVFLKEWFLRHRLLACVGTAAII